MGVKGLHVPRAGSREVGRFWINPQKSKKPAINFLIIYRNSTRVIQRWWASRFRVHRMQACVLDKQVSSWANVNAGVGFPHAWQKAADSTISNATASSSQEPLNQTEPLTHCEAVCLSCTTQHDPEPAPKHDASTTRTSSGLLQDTLFRPHFCLT